MKSILRRPVISAIVEGPGDKDAVPALLRRILWERLSRYDIATAKAISANGKSNLIKKLKSFLRYAILKEFDGILVILDADRECPRKLATTLATEAAQFNLAVPVAVVCCKHEYETWFICNLTDTSGNEIRNKLALPSTLTSPKNVEAIRGPKEWLTQNMPITRAYKETTDQANLTHHIDLTLTHVQSRSFQRMCHAVEELVHAVDNHITDVTPTT